MATRFLLFLTMLYGSVCWSACTSPSNWKKEGNGYYQCQEYYCEFSKNKQNIEVYKKKSKKKVVINSLFSDEPIRKPREQKSYCSSICTYCE